MYKFLILFLTISSIMACNGNKAQHSESKVLYDQVMEVHDEVMPKMSDIRKLSKKLKKIDGFESTPLLTGAVTSLEGADEAMMDWMAQFKMPKGASKEEEMTFLNAQLISAKAMAQKMKDAISNAENIIADNAK